jgi:hypothetical protein
MNSLYSAVKEQPELGFQHQMLDLFFVRQMQSKPKILHLFKPQNDVGSVRCGIYYSKINSLLKLVTKAPFVYFIIKLNKSMKTCGRCGIVMRTRFCLTSNLVSHDWTRLQEKN